MVYDFSAFSRFDLNFSYLLLQIWFYTYFSIAVGFCCIRARICGFDFTFFFFFFLIVDLFNGVLWSLLMLNQSHVFIIVYNKCCWFCDSVCGGIRLLPLFQYFVKDTQGVRSFVLVIGDFVFLLNGHPLALVASISLFSLQSLFLIALWLYPLLQWALCRHR